MSRIRIFESLPQLATVSAFPLWFLPLAQYLAVAPFGSNVFLSLRRDILMMFLLVAPVLVVSPFLLFVRRLRAFAGRALLASVVFTVAVAVGLPLGNWVRAAAFQRLAERSAPLVQAIRSYEARHGGPPPDLTAMVPDFLAEVPGTGMGSAPHYEYYFGDEAADVGNPWVLMVAVPNGSLGDDTFLYLPLQNYGEEVGLERIADWAYVRVRE